MTPGEATVDAWVDAQAALLGLPLDDITRPGVLRYAALAAEMARVVMAVPLTVHDEPGHRFAPVGPGPSAPATGAGGPPPQEPGA